ncbi:hypothetical protein [Paractinoplanes durhamensis]|nr:hypothetical protein [Actinoplanes durhamensis]
MSAMSTEQFPVAPGTSARRPDRAGPAGTATDHRFAGPTGSEVPDPGRRPGPGHRSEWQTQKAGAGPKAAPPTCRHRLGREAGRLAINVYDRNASGVAGFEKDAAKIMPFRWLREALTLSAELSEGVGATYVRMARKALR